METQNRKMVVVYSPMFYNSDELLCTHVISSGVKCDSFGFLFHSIVSFETYIITAIPVLCE